MAVETSLQRATTRWSGGSGEQTKQTLAKAQRQLQHKQPQATRSAKDDAARPASSLAAWNVHDFTFTLRLMQGRAPLQPSQPPVQRQPAQTRAAYYPHCLYFVHRWRRYCSSYSAEQQHWKQK